MDASAGPQKQRSRLATYILLACLFGVFLPWWKGLDFLDPVLLSAYACLGFVFAGPAAAQAFEQRPDSLMDALQRITAAVLLGEAIALGLLFCGIATVYATHRVTFFPADLSELAMAVALGVAGSLALAALAAWTATAFSKAAARTVLRVVLLLLLLAFYLRGRWLPGIAVGGIAGALAASAMFVGLLGMRLRKV